MSSTRWDPMDFKFRTRPHHSYLPLDSEILDEEVLEEVEEKRKVIENLDVELEKIQMRIDDWTMRLSQVQQSATELHTKKLLLEEELQNLLTPATAAGPGPAFLRFVTTSAFTYFSMVIIVINISVMLVELKDPGSEKTYWLLDQLFLLFYVAELVMKACYQQGELLVGKLSEVLWNWFDLLIVLQGVLDQWVQPLLGVQKASAGLQVAKWLRLGRLARIIKIIRLFWQSDLHWTEGANFQTFIMGVIGVNSIIMGFETDVPDFWGWFYVEQVFLVIYTFELLTRIQLKGCSFFCDGDYFWNYMDFSIVVGGILDQWLLPTITFFRTVLTGRPADAIQLGQAIVLLRMARLLRILRLVRLVKGIPPLFKLMQGVISSMQGMTWVFVLTVVVLYAFSILAVRLIGQGIIFGGTAPDEAKGVFPSVMDGMFVLFILMNGEISPVEALLDNVPSMKVVYALYMVATCWAILSILTAVVSENMMSVQEEFNSEKRVAQEEIEEKKNLDKLLQLLSELDRNKNSYIDEYEFGNMLADPDRCKELCDATNMDKFALVELFLILSAKHEKEGDRLFASYEDFIQDIKLCQAPTTGLHTMSLQQQISDLATVMQKQFEALSGTVEELVVQMKCSTPTTRPDLTLGSSTVSTEGDKELTSPVLELPRQLTSTTSMESSTSRRGTSSSKLIIGDYQVTRTLDRRVFVEQVKTSYNSEHPNLTSVAVITGSANVNGMR
eukprot:gnl/MRDRNA2_/MRDRNA2_135022_c0_seq1.p1 gnl/MRDRNA2_/MRDRNA2_135022_c0~~gnl/MRDRNA2_/MRDRNA2_135022_c0_seq1.p1  ORF type:complete len:727 (+),score=129.43 gnl/MRDRNA2_/MRDRNA2_135022_c0_seq1:207-2387(+)